MSTAKTILDVLLEKNRIDHAQASRFPKTATNAEIEEVLRKENLVSSEEIAKAYALIFDLPFIRLVNYPVQKEAFNLIPKVLIEKYQIMAFEKNENRVKIAFGSPAEIKSHPPDIIKTLKEEKGINVDLYITDPQDIKAVLVKFHEQSQALPINQSAQVQNPSVGASQTQSVQANTISASGPTILDANVKPQVNPAGDIITTSPSDAASKVEPAKESDKTQDSVKVSLKDKKISYEIISKFPIEISQKYKMVVFENPSPSLIKVALANPNDPKVQEILNFVRQKNEIAIEEFAASASEIDEAIKLYYKKPIVAPGETQAQSAQISAKPAPSGLSPQPSAMNAEPTTKKEEVEDKPQENVPVVKLKSPAIVAPMANAAPQDNSKPVFTKRPDLNAVETPEEQEEPLTLNAPESEIDKFLGQEVKDVQTLVQIAETGNVPKILAASVALAVIKKASDIHIEPEQNELRIRFRIDGVLKDVIKMPLELQPAIISRIKILSRLKIDEQRVPQDGRFDVKTHGHEIDLRVSTLPTIRGEKAALRILDKTQNIYGLEELGITGRNLKVLTENIAKPFGVILSTGPTGSGKSTTLYSILKQIADPHVNVITLEDPVEYEMPGINQCQVKPKIGFSFAEGLRSVLRQDPNIIMVGEIRDAETASMATHAALTGHLVLSTLHTNDAAGALPSLINMGIEPFLITSAMNAVVGQRLVRKICEH